MEIEQNGVKLYVTTMAAGEIIDEKRVKVDIWSASQNIEGYQRKVSPSRAMDFARYLKNTNAISPTSILLNIRGEILGFAPIKGNYGILSIPDDSEFWVVDGQHRIEGFKELLRRNPNYVNFPITIIIMRVSSEYEEAMQFIIINKTQRGVKPDLAERFIAKMSKREGVQSLMNLPRDTTRDIAWRPKATEIVDILNARTSDEETGDFYNNPWLNKIQLPNEPKGQTTVSQKALEDSLKSLFNNPLFSSYNAEEMSVILVRYWKAILNICKGAAIQPHDYVLQRTTGVNVLHNLLPRVVAMAIKSGEKLTVGRFYEVLNKMPDGMNDIFWINDGVAGNVGTSKKSFSILTTKLFDYLEEGNLNEIEEEKKKPFDL